MERWKRGGRKVREGRKVRGKKRGQKWIEEGGIQRERKKSEKRGGS